MHQSHTARRAAAAAPAPPRAPRLGRARLLLLLRVASDRAKQPPVLHPQRAQHALQQGGGGHVRALEPRAWAGRGGQWVGGRAVWARRWGKDVCIPTNQHTRAYGAPSPPRPPSHLRAPQPRCPLR